MSSFNCGTKFLLMTAMIASFFLPRTHAVTLGYEQYGNLDGYFYCFTSFGTAEIIDPKKQSVVKSIAIDKGDFKWGDTVYIRDQSQLKHHVFLADSSNDRMVVIDTDTQTVLAKTSMGDNPVHIYALPTRDEVWAHLDNSATFDVFHLSQVRYRSTSAVPARSGVIAGHGKLLAEDCLEDTGFATNVKEGYLYEMDLNNRNLLTSVNLTDSAINNSISTIHPCTGTHGIAFSDVNDRIYIECTSLSGCSALDAGRPNCTGSIWGVDSATLAVTERFQSAYLTAKYSTSFGILGQPYKSPEESFIIVPNKAFGMIAVLQPVAGSATLMVEIPTPGRSPGAVRFWPKDSSIAFGLDRNPSNYWAVFALEDTGEDSGVAFLDMADIVKAFADGKAGQTLPATILTYLKVGPGNMYRVFERGNNFGMTPVQIVGASPSDSAVKVALIDLKSKAVLKTFDIKGVTKIQWVPIHTDELSYQMKAFQTSTASSYASKEDVDRAYQAGTAGVVLAVLSLLLSAVLGWMLMSTRAKLKNGYAGSTSSQV